MQYRTITKRGSGEYVDRKSRFIGEAFPVSSEEEARACLEEVRKRNYDARHHCMAYVLDPLHKKASDDGEPQGSAGLPILKVLEAGELQGVLVVVTRYFGGILLGTGGLVRAYTEAAKLALEDAGVVVMQEGVVLELSFGYGLLDRVNYLLEKEGIAEGETEYTDQVIRRIRVKAGEVEGLLEKIDAVSSAQVKAEKKEEGFFGF